MEKLKTLFSPEQLEAATSKGVALGMNVVLAILIIIFGLWISKRVRNAIVKLGQKNAHLDETLFRFFASIARFMILAFVGIAVLGRFGVETTSIIAVLGAATVAVGLALQGSLSNLAAGVMLLIFRPYKVGEFIDAAGTFGNVEEIDLFTTIVRTFDNQQIIIPNSKIWGEKIINHSYDPVRGVDMKFNIAYEDDVSAAREVIKSVLAAHPHVKSDPAPFIEVENLTERSVEILVRPFTDGEHYFDVRYSVPEQIKAALGAAGMATPYPQQKLIMIKD